MIAGVVGLPALSASVECEIVSPLGELGWLFIRGASVIHAKCLLLVHQDGMGVSEFSGRAVTMGGFVSKEELENKKYVAFYWTLPVRFAGFTYLPEDGKEAAKLSKTIRYQRTRVLQWIRGKGVEEPIKEFAFLEVQDDRGSEHIRTALHKVADYCDRENAVLVFVNFGYDGEYRARWHPGIQDFTFERYRVSVRGRCGKFAALRPTPVEMDLGEFDPFQYFAKRREKNKDDAERNRQKAIMGLREVIASAPSGWTYAQIAQALNDRHIATANGGIWTDDNVRHQVQNLAIVDRLRDKLDEIPESSMQYELVAQSLNEEGVGHYSGGKWDAKRVETAIKRKLKVSVL